MAAGHPLLMVGGDVYPLFRDAVSFPNATPATIAVGGGIVAINCNTPTATIVWSADAGVNWNSLVTTQNNVGKIMVYGGGLFVRGSTGNDIQTSSDGSSWAQVSPGLGTFAWSEGAGAYSPALGMYLFVRGAGTADYATSTNGSAWTARTFPSSAIWAGVAWCSGLGMFAVLENGSTGVLTSVDGINWISRTASAATSCNTLSANTSRFVGVSQSSRHSIVSTDGVTWTRQDNVINAARTFGPGVAFGSGYFVAGVNQVYAAISRDGVTWNEQAMSGTNSGGFAAAGGGKYYITRTSSSAYVWQAP